MPKLVMLVMCLCASGCTATLDSATDSVLPNPRTHGYTTYDPCIRCGEEWIFLNIDETKELK